MLAEKRRPGVVKNPETRASSFGFKITASGLAILAGLASAQPAFATIDNTAVANGTYGVDPVASPGSGVSVTVTPQTTDLTITKSAGVPDLSGGADAVNADAGDTITYTYTVVNNGNVTMSAVTPVDPGPTFNGIAGSGSMGAFTLASGTLPLAPGATATFEAVYTLSTTDVFNSAGVTGAVSNTATMQGVDPGSNPFTDPDPSNTATATIPGYGALSVVKTASTPGPVVLNDTITYTYTVTNTGNVAITGVSITDTHEGATITAPTITGESLVSDGPLAGNAIPVVSSDPSGTDGVYDTLQPGAVATFTYVHTVTQTEVDAQ